MELGLDGKVCLVTGSTSGIGLETARQLAAEGARVAVTGRDRERAERARAESGAAFAAAHDLASANAPAKLIDDVVNDLGQIDCLVNNAGEAYQIGFEELTDEQWSSMWELNV